MKYTYIAVFVFIVLISISIIFYFYNNSSIDSRVLLRDCIYDTGNSNSSGTTFKGLIENNSNSTLLSFDLYIDIYEIKEDPDGRLYLYQIMESPTHTAGIHINEVMEQSPNLLGDKIDGDYIHFDEFPIASNQVRRFSLYKWGKKKVDDFWAYDCEIKNIKF